MSDLTAQAISAIANLGKDSESARIQDLDDGSTILLTEKSETGFVEVRPATKDEYGINLNVPNSIRRSITIQDADSLVEYLDFFKQPGTILFADIASNRITAILDYHEAPDKTDLSEHIAVLQLPYSEEWKIWTGAHGKLLSQTDFARFIEENAVDITAPSGADLLEVCRDLQAVRKVDFKKAVRTATDTESFEYTDDTQLKNGRSDGAVEVPTKFKMQLPVYFNGRPVELFAFLRWGLDGPKLELGVALHRAEYVRQAIFKELVQDIASRAGVRAIYGKPEKS